MLTKWACQYLTWQIRKDEDLWLAYQANIAMQIYDAFQKYMPLTTEKKSPTLHEWCNICANNFLGLWTKKGHPLCQIRRDNE